MPKGRKLVLVEVIIPDASPILTLDRIDALYLLEMFRATIHIVDQVHYEITKPQNDPGGRIRQFIDRHANMIKIVETNVGEGFKSRQAKDPSTPGGNLGEIAVEEYATYLAKTTGPSFVPLVLFEDPDVLHLRIAHMKDVHLLNTTAWLQTLNGAGLLPEGKALIERINKARKSPLIAFEKPARTKKVRSQWLKVDKD